MSGNPAYTSETADPELTLEPNGEYNFGPCECCGSYSRSVNGFIHQGEVTRAAYGVHWTKGVSEHPANFDLILGPWGEGADATQRLAISLIYRNDEEQHAFTIIDAKDRPHGSPKVVGRALSREELLGSPELKEWVFTLADFILLHDSRIGTIETKPPGKGSGLRGWLGGIFGRKLDS